MRLTVKRFRMVGNRVCRQECDSHMIYFCTIWEEQGRWSVTTGGSGSRIRNGRGTRRAPVKTWRWKDSVQSEHFCGVLRWKGKRSGRANVTPRLLRTEGSSLSWQRPQPGAPPDPCQLPSWAVAINSRGCGLYPQFSTALITVVTANTVLGIIQNTLTD